MSKTITMAQQVASLEDGYASLLLENRDLGNEVQALTKAVRELEDQQAITRQAYQNLLHEKDTTIAGLDEIVAAKLKHIELLDAALAQAKDANATLGHQLEQQDRRTATSVRIEGWDKQDNMVRANSATCDCDHPGPFDSGNYCVKCGRKYNVPNADKATFGDVELAKRIYHNLHYPAIRVLLGYESCRLLDIVLDL